jgi:hypothetical protein
MTASPRDREYAARTAARAAAHKLALDAGAAITTRPLYHGASTTTRDVEPAAGMQAARDLELAARNLTTDYIRQARENGATWHQIGATLRLHPNGDTQQTGDTTAEAAYTYAAGHPDTEHARRYGQSFTWHCPTCDNTISDRGLISGPADDEQGHASTCTRHQATIAAWTAEWEAGQ